MRRRVLLGAWVLLGGCRLGPATADTPAVVEAQEEEPLVSAQRSVEIVELTIPLFEGGAVELARFRGRVVILEVSASYAEGWAEAHEHYASLLDAHEDDLSVIVVSLDMDTGPLSAWERDPPPFTLGWDPQGALAARLGVSRLPTVFVLDREGALVDEIAGFSDRLVAHVDEASSRALGAGRGL